MENPDDQFPVHSSETAPEGSKPILMGVQKSMGFVPNLIGVMASAPAAAEAYVSLMDIFDRSSLTNAEQQTVLLSVSFANGCHYCMAAHTTLANLKRVPSEVVDALRTGAPVPDSKLDALAKLTRAIVETRGWPDAAARDAFFEARYGTANISKSLSE